ncbi:ATP-dependent 6-phosphofructokinase [Plakobranchus ocellatus]|uniref:ATP-dependent 6-phosphofructokinase n=1 Tax=Plakobranchus ocellatus TaxID=259542 RepID=A0AAV3Z6B2_9GAST|nr:ATP-dependent 6-phosphofructokinase [Plakobranchus ocellatus]
MIADDDDHDDHDDDTGSIIRYDDDHDDHDDGTGSIIRYDDDHDDHDGDTGSIISVNHLSKTILSRSGSSMNFEPVSKLVAETDFENSLPLFMWWMKLRPLLRVLSGAPDQEDLEFTIIVPDSTEAMIGGALDEITPTKSWYRRPTLLD